MIPVQLNALLSRTRQEVGQALQRSSSAAETYGSIAEIYRQPFEEAGEILTQTAEPPQELSAAWFRANTALGKAHAQQPADAKSLVQAYSSFFSVAQRLATQMASPPAAVATEVVAASTQPGSQAQPAAQPAAASTPAPQVPAQPPPAARPANTPAPPANPTEKLLRDLEASGCKIESVDGSSNLIAALEKGRIKATDKQGRTYQPTNPDEYDHFIDYQLGNHDRLPQRLRDLVGVFDDMYKAGYRFFDKESKAELKHPLDAYDTMSQIEINKGEKLRWFAKNTDRLIDFGRFRLDRLDEMDPKVRSELEIMTSLAKADWTFTSDAKTGGKAATTTSAIVAHWWLEDAGTITAKDPSSGGSRKVTRAELQKLRNGGK